MTDRRRINGPLGGTAPPVFQKFPKSAESASSARHAATDHVQKIFLQTGLTPSASGSAYLELEPSSPGASSLKLTCTVHGPRPLPRAAPFSSQLLLSTHVKFTPFATRHRRGYIRDDSERDLSAHLETALRGIIISDRWPKSGIEVAVTILEGGQGDGMSGQAASNWYTMNILAGCITAASAAIVEAGIDCVDLAAGGVAALVRHRGYGMQNSDAEPLLVVSPDSLEHEVMAVCVVGFLASRDELVELWLQGSPGGEYAELIEKAIEGANASRAVLKQILLESIEKRAATN